MVEQAAFRKFASAIGAGAFEPSPDEQISPDARKVHRDMTDVMEAFRLQSTFLSDLYKNEHCRGVDLEARYIIDARINAVASSNEGKDIIGMFLGLYLFVNGLCNMMLDPDATAKAPKTLEEAHAFVPKLDLARELSGQPWYPDQGEEVEPLKKAALRATVTWLLHHELAHIWYGHTELSGAFEDIGNGWTQGAPSGFLPDRVCLEINSDTAATTALLMFECGMLGDGQPRKFHFLDYTKPNWSWPVYILALGVCIGLQAMTLRHRERPTIGTHPPTWFRQESVLKVIKHSFLDQPSEVQAEVKRILAYAPAMVLFALGENQPDDWSFGWAEPFDYGAHARFFEGFWSEYKSLLEPHKRGRIVSRLLPPLTGDDAAPALSAPRSQYRLTVHFDVRPPNRP